MVSTNTILILGTIAVYFLLVIGIGEYARRRTKDNREDFFMASRSFGTLVLLFAILATNLTAFTLIGGPALAYSAGIGAYGYLNGIPGLAFPLLIGTVGYRLWLTGKRFGHITPGQIFNHRFNSKHLGTVIMLIMTFWTVPYLLLGAIGGGVTFQSLTGGVVPYWAGALIPVIIVFLYVSVGGMRGTGYTNVFQGAVFLIFLWGLLFLVASRLGGFTDATQAVLNTNPQLATRSGPPPFATRQWFSFALVLPLGGIMFPHIFRRLLVALDEKTIKRTMVLYPIGLILSWFPALIVGFWGAGQIPGLTGAETDNILPMMTAQFTPVLISGFALAGILAAIMSSLDGQTLAVSTLTTEDIIRKYTGYFSESQEIVLARIFVGVVLLITYVLALIRPGTIVSIAEFAFSGYALIFFPIIVGLYWKNATKYGAFAGLIWGFIGIWAFELGWIPNTLTFGFMPFIPIFVTQIAITLLVSYFTPNPPNERINNYFELFDGVW